MTKSFLRTLLFFFVAGILTLVIYKTDLGGTIVKGAKLELVGNLTCGQIESAVIDRQTRLPDHIYLKWSSGSDYKCIDLRKARKADLRNADLAKIKISVADLREANLAAANLRDANLSQTNLGGANLEGADLRGAKLEWVENLTCEQIESALVGKNTRSPYYIHLEWSSGSDYKCIDLREARKADLRNADLAKIKITAGDFREANLTAANLRDSSIHHSNLEGANLEGADLRGAKLHLARNLTCGQIESAVIDRQTTLPDYIHLEWSSKLVYNCKDSLVSGSK